MTAPIRHSELRGRRTPATLLLISERNKLLLEAAKFYAGASDREIARQLRIALLRYREGRFRLYREDVSDPTPRTPRRAALDDLENARHDTVRALSPIGAVAPGARVGQSDRF
jgi:hypothetical protein